MAFEFLARYLQSKKQAKLQSHDKPDTLNKANMLFVSLIKITVKNWKNKGTLLSI
jgi:hypothetical protein